MAAPNSTTTQGSLFGPQVIVIPVGVLTGLANAQVWKVAIPYNFVVTAALFRVGVAVTTGAKAATLTVQVNGVAVTGGVMALTSANCTPCGAAVAATAITAANGSGAVGQTVEVAVSSVTAFVEGSGYVELTILPTSAG